MAKGRKLKAKGLDNSALLVAVTEMRERAVAISRRLEQAELLLSRALAAGAVHAERQVLDAVESASDAAAAEARAIVGSLGAGRARAVRRTGAAKRTGAKRTTATARATATRTTAKRSTASTRTTAKRSGTTTSGAGTAGRAAKAPTGRSRATARPAAARRTPAKPTTSPRTSTRRGGTATPPSTSA